MPRGTPRQAVEQYVAPFREALSCIAHGTLITTGTRKYAVNSDYTWILNRGNPLELRRQPYITLRAAQFFRIAEGDETQGGEAYRVHTVSYAYEFATDAGREILNYHWTPEVVQYGQRTFPHMHIGRGLLGERAGVFPETFHKLHVPTGRVSFERVIRFAIEELGVPHRRDDWSAVLDHGHRQFARNRFA